MKTIRLNKSILGFGAILVLAIGFSSSAFAGPSSQFWDQQERNRANLAKKAESAKPVDASAMVCPNCKTTKIEQFSGTNGPGRFAPHYTVVGKKHECPTCTGVISTVNGKTTNEMKDNCPICAKAKAAGATCCTTS